MSVLVAGPTATLATLGVDSVVATVDATGRAAGTGPADVVLKVPPGVTVISLQPARVTLTIRSR